MIVPDSEIKRITVQIEKAIEVLVSYEIAEKVWVTHYGANDIDPNNLVFWICVQSDAEKQRLASDAELMRRLRELLANHQYPIAGRDGVFIGFESQETVERDSGGNWWHHWK